MCVYIYTYIFDPGILIMRSENVLQCFNLIITFIVVFLPKFLHFSTYLDPVSTPAHTRPYFRENLLRINLRDALSQPQLSIRKQLFCMTGWNMSILPDMRIKGTRVHYSLHCQSMTASAPSIIVCLMILRYVLSPC